MPGPDKRALSAARWSEGRDEPRTAEALDEAACVVLAPEEVVGIALVEGRESAVRASCGSRTCPVVARGQFTADGSEELFDAVLVVDPGP